MLPLNPDILGVNVFCFSSPSFLKIIILNISNRNGKIRIVNSINIVLLMLLAYVILIIFAKIIATIMLISNKLLRKLSNILYLDSKFNGLLFPSQLVICQSPRVHLANLFIKLLYMRGEPPRSLRGGLRTLRLQADSWTARISHRRSGAALQAAQIHRGTARISDPSISYCSDSSGRLCRRRCLLPVSGSQSTYAPAYLRRLQARY